MDLWTELRLVYHHLKNSFQSMPKISLTGMDNKVDSENLSVLPSSIASEVARTSAALI